MDLDNGCLSKTAFLSCIQIIGASWYEICFCVYLGLSIPFGTGEVSDDQLAVPPPSPRSAWLYENSASGRMAPLLERMHKRFV